MRCKACDSNLDDFESTKKDEQGEFIDLCNRCDTISSQTIIDNQYIDQARDDSLEETQEIEFITLEQMEHEYEHDERHKDWYEGNWDD
jgi:hypothetical protein